MRFAFITPEFPTTVSSAGGLSTYIRRMAGLLIKGGHSVEVFVSSADRADVLEFEGYTVRHVRFCQNKIVKTLDIFLRAMSCSRWAARWIFTRRARRLAAAFESRHAEARFDVVQSSDYLGVGAFIKRSANLCRVVRCSSAIDLYMEADGRRDPDALEQIRIETLAVSQADIVISPSTLVAEHYKELLQRDIHVVRPPAYLEVPSCKLPLPWVPSRFFIHFAGNLGNRKGTLALARALRLAVADARDMVVVLVGKLSSGTEGVLKRELGESAANVVLSHPLEKAFLYPLIRCAEASVLPSVVDNIPNTAIESLLLGTPVIATRGSSIDELITDNSNGMLVEQDDPAGLARAMLRVWRGELPLTGSSWLATEIGKQFAPETSLERYLNVLSRFHAESGG